MKSRAVLPLFFVCAILALAVHFFLFEMRYMWYVDSVDYWILRGGYAACAAVILACWAFFPSRALVALAGLVALFFPHIYYAPDARPLLGRELDPLTIGIALLSVALLVGATQLRRKMKRAD